MPLNYDIEIKTLMKFLYLIVFLELVYTQIFNIFSTFSHF